MPRGSAPGERRGGRQQGAANIKTREIADKAAQEGITPLEYMLSVMRSPIMPELKQAIESGKVDEKVITALSGWHKMRYEAAKDSAPYLHPRLQTTTLQGGDKPISLSITAQDSNVL